MCARRGIDWAIRFRALEGVRNFLSRNNDGKSVWWHHIVAGACGGMLSATTLPLDVIIANSQKAGSKGSILQVTKKLLQSEGYGVLVRGFLGRMLHSGYHTAFVAGGGFLVYSHLENRELSD